MTDPEERHDRRSMALPPGRLCFGLTPESSRNEFLAPLTCAPAPQLIPRPALVLHCPNPAVGSVEIRRERRPAATVPRIQTDKQMQELVWTDEARSDRGLVS